MARRSRGRSAETFDFANSPTFDSLSFELLRPVVPVSPTVSRVDEFLGDTLPFDRREFFFGEPEKYSLVHSEGVSSGLRKGAIMDMAPRIPSQVAFGDSATVAICHRRQVRKEVLHAMRRTRGRGGSRRRSWRSDIKC